MAENQLRPVVMKGHERPLTKIKFNRDGDLLFTCAKDYKPCVWFSDNGERLGTFNGHQGAIYDCDITWDSSRLVTASSDRTARLWDVQSGKELYKWEHKAGIKSVGFSHGSNMLQMTQDTTHKSVPTIFIYNLSEEDHTEQSKEPVRELKDNVEITESLWGSLNSFILCACKDGSVKKWDVERGEITKTATEHKKQINDIQFSADGTMFVTASSDQTAKLWDTKNMEVLKTYTADRPVNSAAISPLMNHLILGGGQEAMHVTQTSAQVGHFEVDFFHLVTQSFYGSVKGHFGPVHTLAFSPNGKSYASGSEDGYVRLHHFPSGYFNNKDVQIGSSLSSEKEKEKEKEKENKAKSKKAAAKVEEEEDV